MRIFLQAIFVLRLNVMLTSADDNFLTSSILLAYTQKVLGNIPTIEAGS